MSRRRHAALKNGRKNVRIFGLFCHATCGGEELDRRLHLRQESSCLSKIKSGRKIAKIAKWKNMHIRGGGKKKGGGRIISPQCSGA